jgi:CheY-like chemotaxis protein
MHQKARILDVGNCDPDHAAIKGMLQQYFDVDVDRVMYVEDALQQLAKHRYRLVLVNRLVFADGSEGMPLIQRMQEEELTQDVPVMMVSNYADAQKKAIASGAVRGFGKADLGTDGVIELLKDFLPVAAN